MNKEKIKGIYQEFKVPVHVRAHMKAVANVCRFICNGLSEKGIQTRDGEVIMAALLHDALRVCDMKNFEPKSFPQETNPEDLVLWQSLREKYQNKGHELAMADILRERGEDFIANLIEKHKFTLISELSTIEEKILYYADKRVNGDQIVSLKERFLEGGKRNYVADKNLSIIKECEDKVYQLEESLAELLGESIYSL
jgi:HD superfamily phosphohydrolase YqeK